MIINSIRTLKIIKKYIKSLTQNKNLKENKKLDDLKKYYKSLNDTLENNSKI